jgi:PiT family inorganic phosphate transporter
MVDFGDDYRTALAALCAGLCAIVIWAVAAWIFGIPTSESHALVAGISGAGIAVSDSFSSINGPEIMKVVYVFFFQPYLVLLWDI